MEKKQFSKFFDYLELEKKNSAHTITAYKNDLFSFSDFINDTFKQADLRTVHYSQIRSWIIFLVEQQLSHTTINRKMSSLKAYYKFLLKTKQIEVSPLAKHRALKTSKKVQVPFSEAEMKMVLEPQELNGFEELRNRLMVELFYSTGIRRSELIHIKMQDFNLESGTLRVTGKGNKQRIIPLLPGVCNTLSRYLEERKTLKNEVLDPYLFLTSTGVKMYDSLVYRTINNYFRGVSSKLKKSPHILRHSFATHLLNQGAHINAVKELLGHSTLAATQVYTKNSMAELNKVYRNAHPRNGKKTI